MRFYCKIIRQAIKKLYLCKMCSTAVKCNLLTQSLLKLVKGSRQAAKQAFIHLETRVLRPDKMKIQQLESGVIGQEGEEEVRRKPRLPPPLEQTAHEKYYSSLAPP